MSSSSRTSVSSADLTTLLHASRPPSPLQSQAARMMWTKLTPSERKMFLDLENLYDVTERSVSAPK